MRVMVMIKSDPETEAGAMPSEEMLAGMQAYNEELVEAGIMLAGEGLHASSKGKRVRFSNGKASVIDGPFTDSKELLAGFWIWQVKSMDEAIEWVKRMPVSEGSTDEVIEIRRIFEDDDFGEAFTPELRERERRLRDDVGSHTTA